MKQFRIAILGQGRSGRDIHGMHLQKDTERFRVVAVVDLLEKRRERAAQEYGCDVYEDYTALFDRDDIDLVVNSTPSHLHYAISKDLLEHGFNVLCEKPCVPTVAEFDDLCETAKRKNVHFLVFQQSRFADYFLQVKKVIASGKLGRIVHIAAGTGSAASTATAATSPTPGRTRWTRRSICWTRMTRNWAFSAKWIAATPSATPRTTSS